MRHKFLALLTALFLGVSPTAHADIGGQVPSPGNCDYPGVGTFGMDFGVYHYNCSFPTEINGSHWQCIYAGAAGQVTAGVSFMFLNASVSLPVGVLEGACWFACPDLRMAETPNPPGAWKSYLVPSKCHPIGDVPVQFGPPVEDPPADPPVGAPPEPVVDPTGLWMPVTDPVRGNPEATVNQHR